MSDYQDQVARMMEESEGFAKIVQKIGSLKDSNARILNFSHHDLDGVTSATILKRLLKRHTNVEIITRIPLEFRLTPEELEEELGKDDYDLLIISDKGTFAYYDDFLGQISEVMIIDHHLKDGKPDKCIILNPSLDEEVGASTSLLVHMLVTHFGLADDYDDFIALLGCRGDYIVDPVSGQSSDFAEPFVERAKQKFSQLFVKKRGSTHPVRFWSGSRDSSIKSSWGSFTC